jgi:hypothetical protein
MSPYGETQPLSMATPIAAGAHSCPELLGVHAATLVSTWAPCTTSSRARARRTVLPAQSTLVQQWLGPVGR